MDLQTKAIRKSTSKIDGHRLQLVRFVIPPIIVVLSGIGEAWIADDLGEHEKYSGSVPKRH